MGVEGGVTLRDPLRQRRYAGRVEDNDNRADEPERAGLCVQCRHMQRIVSERGSVFLLCRRSRTDPSFPKYPRLPVLGCSGFESKVDNE